MDRSQPSFLDFDQPMGLKMNPENRWIKMADLIPWNKFEVKYAEQFPSNTGNVARDIRYLEQFMEEGYALDRKEIPLYLTICTLYVQQKYMYDNKTHSVEHRIVSITQPWIRPIVRGKVKAPVEFGAKLDLSIDSEGYARIEKISFEAYNESTCLVEAVERFRERSGYYPERVLADQIYLFKMQRRILFALLYLFPKWDRYKEPELQISA